MVFLSEHTSLQPYPHKWKKNTYCILIRFYPPHGKQGSLGAFHRPHRLSPPRIRHRSALSSDPWGFCHLPSYRRGVSMVVLMLIKHVYSEFHCRFGCILLFDLMNSHTMYEYVYLRYWATDQLLACFIGLVRLGNSGYRPQSHTVLGILALASLLGSMYAYDLNVDTRRGG
ncbi:hypothetical protein BS78_K197600 [Paspalum vaginatum]|uniref:Uncharacterized protein n=1 Tax=Paspalum vaginatum TaxID=158149 RepID=A0A9W8CGD8_9POAL|nr:hypothetical protein BS78_K197600 [Paspalum vaginatum]